MVVLQKGPSVKPYFTNTEAERIVKLFAEVGMKIELGAQYSVKGQIAQLINGVIMVMEHFERDVE